MGSTFKVLFYLKRNKEKSQPVVPVMGRITVNGTLAQFSAKLTVPEISTRRNAHGIVTIVRSAICGRSCSIPIVSAICRSPSWNTGRFFLAFVVILHQERTHLERCDAASNGIPCVAQSLAGRHDFSYSTLQELSRRQTR